MNTHAVEWLYLLQDPHTLEKLPLQALESQNCHRLLSMSLPVVSNRPEPTNGPLSAPRGALQSSCHMTSASQDLSFPGVGYSLLR